MRKNSKIMIRFNIISKLKKMKKLLLLMSVALSFNMVASAQYIALSFDDGPNTTTTPKVLDLLEENGVKASFFVIGQNITPESAVVMQRAAKMGCTIENHSFTHKYMSRMDEKTLIEEIAKTDALIEHYVGRTPQFFRPPYINHGKLMHDTIAKTFICGVGCNDWEASVSAEQRLETMLSTIKNGDIFLLHDFEGNEATVEALRKLIPEMKKRGFIFVTVPEIFELNGKAPQAHDGEIYTNVL